MGKRNFTAYLDDDLIKIAQSKSVNLSNLFNKVLENIAERSERLDDIDEDTIKENIIKLTEDLNTNKALLLQIDIKKHGKILSTSEEVEINED